MPRPLPTKPKAWIAITLTWNAGFVDAAGYLLLFHIYTAHMSGHSVALGTYSAQLKWSTALFQHGWPVLTFVWGLFLCSLINELGGRWRLRSISSITLGLEAVLLGAFILSAPRLIAPGGIRSQPAAVFAYLLPLLTMAMGLQTSSLIRVGSLSLYTTYVNGVLAKLADATIEYLGWFYDRTRGRLRRRLTKVILMSPRQKAFRDSALMAGMWLGYAAGAVCGALLKQKWQSSALALPLGALILIISIDLVRPVAPPFPGKKVAKHRSATP
jgi:uncharacterized membrane protein YoaK (UPF0700 family)